MFNGLAINPAYAGSNGVLTATALVRYQSVGLTGAPNTQSLAIHSPLLNKKIGIGLLLVRDNISIINQYSLSAMYAYRIKITEKGHLALGLQGGINSINAEYTRATIFNPNDPAFQQDVRSTRPNFGFGIYYDSERLTAGVSMPQLANNVFTRGPDLSTVKQDNPIILTVGYVINLSRAVKFKPSTLLKFVAGEAVEYDLNAQFSFDDVLWVGASVRFLNAVDILAAVQITRQLRFGYSYSLTTNALSRVALGSHEVMISYQFKYPKDALISPRFF
jgi:type IX secretion system PorP/SprF family membrane protein